MSLSKPVNNFFQKLLSLLHNHPLLSGTTIGAFIGGVCGALGWTAISEAVAGVAICGCAVSPALPFIAIVGGCALIGLIIGGIYRWFRGPVITTEEEFQKAFKKGYDDIQDPEEKKKVKEILQRFIAQMD